MTQTFYPITPVEVVPGTDDEWTDVDASAHVPSGATGVILHLVNKSEETQYVGLRKNGSTDNRTGGISRKSHCWAAIGVDSNRIFEAYVSSLTFIDIYVVGYTMSGVVFLTNAAVKSLATTSEWTNIDCAVQAPSATGLIWEILSTSTSYDFGMRKDGSSDARINATAMHNAFGVIIGCSGSQVVEGYIENAVIDFFLVGYIPDGAIFNTNAIDVSMTTESSWLDLAALPANSIMGFIEITCSLLVNYGLRKNGSSEDIYYNGLYHPWSFVECDSSHIIEGKIENDELDFFVVGYATKVAVTGPFPTFFRPV